MPTAFRHGPYRFFFVSGDRGEPVHVHVEGGGNTAKFWVNPEVELARNYGFAQHELNQIHELIVENRALILGRWRDHFEGD